jgi:PAS domain S-box-containing protein
MTRRGGPSLLYWPAALAAGGLALALVLTSNHEKRPALSISLGLVAGWSFIASGLIAWSRRPENRTGKLLVAVGFVWFVGAFNDANGSIPFTVSVALSSVFLAVFIHLLVAYPSGRLGSVVERVVVGSAYAVSVIANVSTMLFDPDPAKCAKCPDNAFLVTDDATLRGILSAVWNVAGVAIGGAVLVILVRRWRSASVPARRALAPVLASGFVMVFFLALLFALDPVSKTARDIADILAFAAFICVPLAFLAGIMRSRLARGVGVGRLLRDVPEEPSLEQAQEGLRRALRDPTLQLAYWVPEQNEYVDVEGHPLPLPEDGAGRATTKVDYDDRPVAALVHDPVLRDEPELVAEVVAAARLALEKDRLQAELRARLVELESERDFVRTVVNAAPSFFCVVDLEGRIVRFNNTLASTRGRLDDETSRGRPFWELFCVADERDELRRAILATAAGGSPLEHEHYMSAAHGKRRAVEWWSRPVSDARGEPRLLICGVDITDRKSQEEELRRLYGELEARHGELQAERDFLSTIANTTPSLLCVVGPDGRVAPAGVNRGFADTMGYSDTEAVGRPFWELVVSPSEAEPLEQALAAVAAGEPTVQHEGYWTTRDGKRLLVAWSSTPIIGKEELFLVCGVDVSERKRQEEELRASRARIVEAGDSERRRLERNLHDGAQQRLVSLSLSLRLAQAKVHSDPHAADEILSGASVELALALEELRELARGIHPAVLTDRGLGPALESLAGRVPLPVEVAEVPQERLPGPVEAAAFYVISEALANVAKYAQASAVSVRVQRENGYALVEVADDGVGGADPARGSGLRGLADRVEALDGLLRVTSLPGRGTQIQAKIPCA